MRREKRGLTLLECLVYIVILAMAIGLLHKLLQRRYEATQAAIRADGRLLAVQRLERRLRDDIMSARAMVPGRVAFTMLDGSTVTWTDGEDGRLQRVERDTEHTQWRVYGRSAKVDARGVVSVTLTIARVDPDNDPEMDLTVVEQLGARR